MRAEWFGGVNEKETMPIILVHDFGGNRNDLKEIALRIQKELEAAVIVPDLRGHGESLTVKGSDKELDPKRFKKNQLLTMAEDIDTCRRFLQEKNDLGELNLDLLTVVACGRSCVHAVNWCINDWRWEPIGGVKQGQNVKALVLVSPRRKFKSVSITPSLKEPLFTRPDGLPVLVVWGENDEAIYVMAQGTNATGSDLINERPKTFVQALKLFFEAKVLANKDAYPWQSRASK